MANFLSRLKKKLLSLLPIIIGGLFLLGLLSIIFWIIEPWLPEKIRTLLDTLSQSDFDTNKQSLKAFFEQYGAASQLVFLLVQLMQVLFAPIPGQLTGALGGFLFGFWQGLLLTMIGLTLGSWIAIYLSRLIGERWVRRFVPEKLLKQFDTLIAEGGVFNFFVIFLLPALPDDAICFMAGLTRLKIWHLVLACLLGRLPGMAVLTFIGSSLESDLMMAKMLFITAMVAAFLLWIYDDVFSRWVEKKINTSRP
ncbi:TVP38/TMEM64 family protein [Magnetococcales bacterium HHB-1]